MRCLHMWCIHPQPPAETNSMARRAWRCLFFPKCQDTSFCMGCCLHCWGTNSDCSPATSSFGPMNAEKQPTWTDDRWIVGGFLSPQPGGYLNKGQRSTSRRIGIIFLINFAIEPHRWILATSKQILMPLGISTCRDSASKLLMFFQPSQFKFENACFHVFK